MHRALVIVINGVAFPVLGLVRGLCPSLALSFARGRGAWRLCQFYALITTTITKRPIMSAQSDEGEGEGLGYIKTHSMDPKAGLRGDHEHASRL
jgi:hypothetical protein